MSKKVGKITVDEWVKAAYGQANVRPEGAFTTEEAMKLTGYKRTTMMRKLVEDVAAGKLKQVFLSYNGKTTRFFIPVKDAKD